LIPWGQSTVRREEHISGIAGKDSTSGFAQTQVISSLSTDYSIRIGLDRKVKAAACIKQTAAFSSPPNPNHPVGRIKEDC